MGIRNDGVKGLFSREAVFKESQLLGLLDDRRGATEADALVLKISFLHCAGELPQHGFSCFWGVSIADGHDLGVMILENADESLDGSGRGEKPSFTSQLFGQI